ncbi:MAG: DUF3578 domain-containing protein [Bacilli bacterium]|nr:DUF3578 domain-containing protein [Bacilli bacterium]
MIAEKFQYILDHYIDGNPTVSSSSPIYSALVNELPALLKEKHKFRKDLLFKGSMGQGNKTEYPWLCVFNTNITRGARYGIYLVYLFRKDMSGFYLALSQGVTYFEEMYQRKKYDALKTVVKYFRSQIDIGSLSTDPINLIGTRRGTLGYGYEVSTIVSKFYATNSFNDEMIVNDLNEMLSIYDEIYRHMNVDSYKEIINRIVVSTSTSKTQMMKADEAIEAIKTSLEPVDGQPYDFSKQLREVSPYIDTSKKYREITNPIIRKVDYIKKAKKDAETGYLGEMMVLEYEKKRLENLGLGEYIDKVEHVSVRSDGFGYDIESYDLVGTEIKKIYIEVKTTSNKVDIPFQVSKGEVDKSKELKKQYFIYRVYDINKDPKMYRVSGQIEEHFDLDPITYLAKYKG